MIEDLNQKGVRFCHAQTPLTYAQAAAFLDAQARFHAQSWNDPVLLAGNTPMMRRAAETRDGLAAYFASLTTPDKWSMFTHMARGAAIPRILHDRDRFLEGFSRLMAFGATQPKTMLMGDEHLGNLYIEADGTPGFLDFQSAFDPWCQGISYFISNALDVVDRRAWERSLLTHYLGRLTAYGVDAPTFEEAWEAYCRYLIFPHFVWLTNGAQFQTEAVNTANAVRGAMAVIDNDSFARLGL
jgi:aminoglycoside/choline kinase family phosphotransferase